MFKALDILSGNFDKLAQNRDVLKSLFTARQWSRIAPVLSDINGNTEVWVESLTEGKDASEGMETQMDAFNTQLKLFNNNILASKKVMMELTKDMGSVFLPIMNDSMQALLEMEDGFGKTAIQIATMTSGVFALQTALSALAGLGGFSALAGLLSNPILTAGLLSISVGVSAGVLLAKQKKRELDEITDKIKEENEAYQRQREKIEAIRGETDLYKTELSDLGVDSINSDWENQIDLIAQSISQVKELNSSISNMQGLKFISEITLKDLDKARTSTNDMLNRFLDTEVAIENNKKAIEEYKKELAIIEYKEGLEEPISEEQIKRREELNLLIKANGTAIELNEDSLKRYKKSLDNLRLSEDDLNRSRIKGYADYKAEIDKLSESLSERDKAVAKMLAGKIVETPADNYEDWLKNVKQFMPEIESIMGQFSQFKGKKIDLVGSKNFKEMLPYVSFYKEEIIASNKVLEETDSKIESIKNNTSLTSKEKEEQVSIEKRAQAASENNLKSSMRMLKTIRDYIINARELKKVKKDETKLYIEDNKILNELIEKNKVLKLDGFDALKIEENRLKIKKAELEVISNSYKKEKSELDSIVKKYKEKGVEVKFVGNELQAEGDYAEELTAEYDAQREKVESIYKSKIESAKTDAEIIRNQKKQTEYLERQLSASLKQQQQILNLNQSLAISINDQFKLKEHSIRLDMELAKNNNDQVAMEEAKVDLIKLQQEKRDYQIELSKQGVDLREKESDLEFEKAKHEVESANNREKGLELLVLESEKIEERKQSIQDQIEIEKQAETSRKKTITDRNAQIQAEIDKLNQRASVTYDSNELAKISIKTEELRTLLLEDNIDSEEYLNKLKELGLDLSNLELDTEVNKTNILQEQLRLRIEQNAEMLNTVNMASSFIDKISGTNFSSIVQPLTGLFEQNAQGKNMFQQFGSMFDKTSQVYNPATGSAMNVVSKGTGLTMAGVQTGLGIAGIGVSVVSGIKGILDKNKEEERAERRRIAQEQLQVLKEQLSATLELKSALTGYIQDAIDELSELPTRLNVETQKRTFDIVSKAITDSIEINFLWELNHTQITDNILKALSGDFSELSTESIKRPIYDQKTDQLTYGRATASDVLYSPLYEDFTSKYSDTGLINQLKYITETSANELEALGTKTEEALGIMEDAFDMGDLSGAITDSWEVAQERAQAYLDILTEIGIYSEDEMKRQATFISFEGVNFKSTEDYVKELEEKFAPIKEMQYFEGMTEEEKNKVDEDFDKMISSIASDFEEVSTDIAKNLRDGIVDGINSGKSQSESAISSVAEQFKAVANDINETLLDIQFESVYSEIETLTTDFYKELEKIKNAPLPDFLNGIKEAEIGIATSEYIESMAVSMKDLFDEEGKFLDVNNMLAKAMLETGASIETVVSATGESLQDLGKSNDEIFSLWENGIISWDLMRDSIGDSLDLQKKRDDLLRTEREILDNNLKLAQDRVDKDKENIEAQSELLDIQQDIIAWDERQKEAKRQITLIDAKEYTQLESNLLVAKEAYETEKDNYELKLDMLQAEKEISDWKKDQNDRIRESVRQMGLINAYQSDILKSDLETLKSSLGTAETYADRLEIMQEIRNAEDSLNDYYRDQNEAMRQTYISSQDILFAYDNLSKTQEELNVLEKEYLEVKKTNLGLTESQARADLIRLSSKFELTEEEDLQLAKAKEYFEISTDIYNANQDILGSIEDTNDAYDKMYEKMVEMVKASDFQDAIDVMGGYLAETVADNFARGVVDAQYLSAVESLSNRDISTLQDAQIVSSEIQALSASMESSRSMLSAYQDILSPTTNVEYKSTESAIQYQTGTTTSQTYHYTITNKVEINDSIGFSDDAGTAIAEALVPYIEQSMSKRR